MSNDIMLTEHVLEVRYVASGTFLDLRGYIADYLRQEDVFPHWKIEPNVVNFRDESDNIKSEGAFVGYRSAGYVSLNPQTRNYFTDRASSFWKVLSKNKQFTIPELVRFGARTKVFVPSSNSFEQINKSLYEGFFTKKGRDLTGGKERDLQFTIELEEDVFNLRIIVGPLHTDEAEKHFQFESDQFKNTGLFLDIDCYKTEFSDSDSVPKLLAKAMEITWRKAEQIASGVGL